MKSAHFALAVTTDILTTAAASTPLLKDSVLTKVHKSVIIIIISLHYYFN